MATLNIHHVTKVELASRHVDNGGCRTLRITSEDHNGHRSEFEITVFGVTDALEGLPLAANFREFSGGYEVEAA